MPNYDYKCKKCDHIFELQKKIADRDKPLKDPCPACGEKELVRTFAGGCPGVVDAFRTGLKKPDQGFRDMLAKVKEAHPAHKMPDRY
jgi:putative FmdB family regulatory protein